MEFLLSFSSKAGIMKKGVAALVIFLWPLLHVLGQLPFPIDDTVEERNFMPYELVFLTDTSNSLTFQEIRSGLYDNRFQVHNNYHNTDFIENASYWIKLPIQHSKNSEKVWLLEFYDQSIDYIEAHIPESDGRYETVFLGDQYPFGKRLFQHKNFELRLDAASDTTVTYYFKVKSHEFADLRIALRSANRFVYYALNEYLLFGTFYGMILIISLYNLLVYLAIREIKNVYYIFYILSVAGYALSLDGIGFQYVWPHHPEWNNYIAGIFLYSLIIWSLVFTRKFLSTKANAPKLDRALKWMIVIRSVLFVSSFMLFPQYLTYRSLDILPLSLVFYTAITVWKYGYKPARFFVIAYGFLFTGFFLRMLVYFNVLPFTIASHYSLHFSFVLEMLFLTFALGDRIRILKDMRDKALRRIIHQHEVNMQLKDKVNRELEEKVLARTRELDKKNQLLEETNKRLVQQAEKINRINSMLDLDNWKLKSSIKEVLNDRLQEKIMNYDQFKTLYPDKMACFRFLEELKWQHGFGCKKCSNAKYFKGTTKFSRRCTRCGYCESITAFTIFHSIKFPIEKAFYVAYLTVSHKNDQTLEELSKTLKLSVNTVWSFKNKVTSRLTELNHLGRGTSVSNWSEIIMDKPSQKVLQKGADKLVHSSA